MPHLLENVFTADAVQDWSPIVRQAWLERKTNPDGYLRSLPPPGQRLATGSWSAQEEATFEQRLNEFRHNKWPISYWGIFSLALPHRTGSQCRHFYRHSPWYLPGEETASIPLAALRTCLEQHKPTLSTLWTSPVAQQIQTRVDAWLRGERSPASEPSIIAPPQSISALQKNQKRQHSGANDGKMPPQGARKTGLLPLAELKQTSAAAAMEVRHPKKSKTLSGVKRSTISAAIETRVTSKSSLNRNKKTNLGPGGGGGGGNVIMNDDSEDEFVAGTLRKVQVIQQKPINTICTTNGGTNNASSTGGKGKTAAALKGKRRGRRPALLADGTAAVAIQQDFDEEETERMTIIRLDKERNLPGWVSREVKPYYPLEIRNQDAVDATATATDTAPAPVEGSKIVFSKDILTFNFTSLGSETFTGVIINAPLSENPQNGITMNQIATLALTDCLASDAIVCLWATKQHVGQAVNCMAKTWGCKYVENLTWVHIAPNGDVAKGPSTLTRTSHSTLVMGRRGGGELELRHQRSPDVIVEPVRGGGKFPDSVREMMETLLPEAKHAKQGKANGKTQQQPQHGDDEKKVRSGARFLEISFYGPEPGVRSGWVKLVQR